jgi:hypothetical protein
MNLNSYMGSSEDGCPLSLKKVKMIRTFIDKKIVLYYKAQLKSTF